MNSSIIRSWNGRTIRQREDGYLSLTDMAQACGRLVKDWFKLQSTASHLVALVSKNPSFSIRQAKSIDFTKWGFSLSQLGNGRTELVEVYKGSLGNDYEKGTWGHRKVAIRFAQWCSDEFAVQVDEWIEDRIHVGILTQNWNDSTISFAANSLTIAKFRIPKGYVNAAQMCKANGKLWADYARLKSTKAYWEALSDDIAITISQPKAELYAATNDMGIPISLIVEVDAYGKEQGTWVHPEIAIDLGAWISPAFRVWV